jgi:hypothetical protein
MGQARQRRHQTGSMLNLDVVAVEVLARLVIGRIVVLRLEDVRFHNVLVRMVK